MDQLSFANYSYVTIEKAEISLDINFDCKIVNSKVKYQFKSLTDSLTQIILDHQHVEVLSLNGPGTFQLGQAHDILGTPLIITLDSELQKGELVEFTIESNTTSKCRAITWLNPSQTAGKIKPYCYTQCESIHCRTIFPIMDTPQVKFLVSYQISVDEDLTAVAAAIHENTQISNGKRITTSSLNIPIQSYLVAFAAGDIACQQVNERISVYTEPSMLEACSFEFSITEEYLSAAEQLLSPYVWRQYNILVLPPSFPYGGMENPTLTFVTPTLVAGDRSLTSMIAHEIAHSWTGNLVTNGNWNHFWINEGFTVYVERKIQERVFGIPFAHLAAQNGLSLLQDAVNLLGQDNIATRLVFDCGQDLPEKSISRIPYEKGYQFLMYLEQTVGEQSFIEFLRNWIETYKLKSVVTEDFIAFFDSQFPETNIEWEQWIRSTGMPHCIVQLDTTLKEQVENVFSTLQNPETTLTPDQLQSLNVNQQIMLLDLALGNTQAHFNQWGNVFGLKDTINPELKYRWLRLCVQLKQEDELPKVREFLTSMGRLRFVRPLFRELVASGYKEFAKEIYEEIRNFYSSLLVHQINQDCKFE